MHNNTKRAVVAIVPVGHLEIEGLMAEDGEYGIAIPQVAKRFSFPIKHASRDLKAMLDKDSSLPTKWKTDLNSKAVNVITLKQFEKVVFELALKGNQGAVDFCRALIGDSLEQLFADAFGKKREKEER